MKVFGARFFNNSVSCNVMLCYVMLFILYLKSTHKNSL